MPTKHLVVGFDALEPRLVERWVASGDLPAFKRLADAGLWAPVHNPPRRFSGASWPTFYTSAQPGAHGQYMRTEFDTDTYAYRGDRPSTDRLPPFWQSPAWRDKRLAVLNLPYAPLTPEINGVQLVEWGVHDHHEHQPTSAPADFAAQVIAAHGRDPVGLCEIENRSPAAFKDFEARLLNRTKAKRDLSCKLLQDSDWDLFLTVFDECHCGGHETWHLHDPRHPLHDPSMNDPLKRIYQGLDQALGQVLEAAGPEARILVLSTHGMGPTSDCNLTMDEILRRIDGDAGASGTQTIGGVKRLLRHVPAPLLSAVRPLRERVALSMNEKIRRRDRAGRRFFNLFTQDYTGGVRLNLVGREAEGKVRPGEEQEAVTRFLIEELNQLVDGATGAKLVREILRAEEIDYGPSGYEGSPPDLVIEWAVKSPKTIDSPRIGSVDPVYCSRTGDHRMQGFAIAAGPGVAQGRLNDSLGLEDFAPSLAEALALPAEGLTGRPIEALRQAA